MSKLAGAILIVAVGILAFLLYFLSPSFLKTTYSAPGAVIESVEVPKEPEVIHITTPNPVKAIYMTACVAGTPSWRTSLKKLVETTELNSILIDIKDYTGRVSFPNNFPKSEGARGCTVSDMKEFIAELHASNIYVLGRISVFQDSSYTKLFPELAVKKKSDGGVWKDNKGLSFIDVGATPYWDYIVDISKESYAIGFDEINYDYIRYPSDGNMKDTHYTWTVGTSTKSLMLENFFAYLYDEMKDVGAVTSADLFGMTMTIENDMNIGQIFELALPYFDYIAPMVYPSHYPKTWNGFANPAEHPYEVIKIAMKRGVERERAWNISRGSFTVDASGATTTPASKLRPWLQDFNLGATYGADKVKAQIQATYDVGLVSWMLWDAGNTYTKEALLAN